MEYTFSTVYMAIIASNILLILLTCFFRNKKIMINAGYRLLAIFVVLTFIRFLLPFEMPFAKTLMLPEWISVVISRIQHPLLYIGNYELSLWAILQIIWGTGFLIKLVQYIRLQLQTRYYILTHMWDVSKTEPYQSILDKICAEKKHKNAFQVAEVAGLKMPLLYGIVKPHILLPKDYSISEEDLYYVLAHETSHHFHHDLITKFLVRFIDMIYWWNPFCRTLTRQTDIILEMRIDDVITDSDGHTIANYLRCLLQLTENVAEAGPISGAVSMPLLTLPKDKDSDMEKRFEMLAASNQKKRYSLNLILLALVLCLYLSSYTFVLEAYYATPENVEATFAPTEADFYAILKEDNTYDIYYGDIFLENTDSLEYHGEIQIYTEKEYYHEEH